MKKILGAILVGFLLSSCAAIDYTAESEITKWTESNDLAKINSARLILLEPGMSKSQVLETMGTNNAWYVNNPYFVSLFSIKEDNITIIYYYTKNPYRVSQAHKRLTPLVLLNGKLIGWGEESLRRAQDKYDFTIKKDFDIKVE